MAETAHAGSYGGPTSSSSSGSGDGVKEQAQEKAQQVAGQAKDQAQQVAGQAKSQISTQVDQRSTQAGQQISQQASDIRSVGEQLRSQGKDGPARIADQVAERIEGVGGWLTNSSGDKILHDIEDVARRQPWAVMAGGLALGFLASRFLKASSNDRYTQRYDAYAGTRGQLPATTGPTYGTPSTGGLEYGTGVGTTGTYGTGTSGYATGEERFTRPEGTDPSDELRPPAGSGGL